MKALVLAGGSGTRLRPISYTMPKQLVPVANRPVLEYALENVRELGATDVGIIVGDWAREIAAVVGDGSRFGLRTRYIRQERPLGLAHCIRLARSFLGDDDFVLYLGDVMLHGDVRPLADDFLRRRPAAQLVVARAADPRSFGVVETDADGAVRRMVEKPEEPRSDMVATGVYFFTPAVHEAVAAIGPGARGELEVTDAVQWLVDRGLPVGVCEFGGYWKDTGRAEDVLECNRRLLHGVRTRIAGEVDPDSELVGPVVVERGARVVRSRVEGPAVIGAGTVVADSRVGPYTSIGENCTLRASEVSDSVVFAAASIRAVAGLHGSLIGRGACVAPGGRDGARHRLVVGDHARVEIAA
ncbi:MULTISPECIES: glucose-1-phosphate thymidylyltransferase [Streptomyces]|uniref:Glucose-1-phosphate thymidylyltransferase n=1 Tax=Streptomyces desertarenae TaxID=2666184 RepID=A0ABW4PPR8_9ACTN